MKLNPAQIASAAAGIALLTLAVALGFRPQPPTVSASNVLDGTGPVEAAPDSLGNTYFILRRDVRRCASPLCGGYFASRVNRPRTRCADGRNMTECYVAEIDWNGQTQVEGQRTLVRGDLLSRFYRRFGQLGVLRVTETWEAGSGNAPTGEFFRVTDRGVRCITHPCLTHHEAKLNLAASREIAGVELNGTGASESRIGEGFAAMTGPEGVLVSGSHRVITGPGGRAQTLQASQFYLRAGGWVGKKQCRKTGCSSQICSDQDVITTCEYRSEYECYKRAACERQANGQCGFTMTPELRACLNRRRNP